MICIPMGKWSQEAVLRNRRRKKARRAFRDSPLFAWEMVGELYQGDYAQFCKDCSRQPRYRGRKKTTGKENWFLEERDKLVGMIREGEELTYSQIAFLERLGNGKDYKIGVPTRKGGFYWMLPKKLTQKDVLTCMDRVNKCWFTYQKKHILKIYTYPNYQWDLLCRTKEPAP